MGYTHYWSVGEEGEKSFAFLLADTKSILEAVKGNGGIKIVDGFGTPDSHPTLAEGLIRFNGEEPEDYETFYFAKDERGFQFCKTGQRPYDAVVCAVLIRARVHYGDGISITSNGGWGVQDEWEQGELICRELFGEVVNPLDKE